MLKWGQPRGVLITNVHVLAGVEFYKGRMIGVYARRFATANWVRIRTVYAASRSADLAILECPFKGPWLTASVKWPKRGETVYAIGWPKGKFAITAGKVVPKDRFDREILKKNTWRGFRHSAATARGSSGGPIINANGYFLGVHFAASAPLSETKKRGYAIDKNTLDQVVKRYAKRAVR